MGGEVIWLHGRSREAKRSANDRRFEAMEMASRIERVLRENRRYRRALLRKRRVYFARPSC
jgi:hypothetical protein